jgi:L-alanine-DL-glutamate epimerase-like enolase superfamily enzyme
VTPSAGALAEALGALPVHVSGVEVRQTGVALNDYQGGPRPSSAVRLVGGGHAGEGENVAFTAEEHARFAAEAEAMLRGPGGAKFGRLDAMIAPAARGYARAALEAALIDLALRQAGTTLAALTGVACGSLRFVVSFAACADPAARVRSLRAGYRGPGQELKIDVDPTWGRDVEVALASHAGIAVLDFKGRGDAELAGDLSALFPGTIFEDPPAGTAHPRVARDGSLSDARAVAVALARGEAVNIKAPRMGGPLEALRALELAARAAGTAYLGGMFEVGVGRRQARQLAALFCPAAPNDLAGLVEDGAPPRGSAEAAASPALIRLDTPGFG